MRYKLNKTVGLEKRNLSMITLCDKQKNIFSNERTEVLTLKEKWSDIINKREYENRLRDRYDSKSRMVVKSINFSAKTTKYRRRIYLDSQNPSFYLTPAEARTLKAYATFRNQRKTAEILKYCHGSIEYFLACIREKFKCEKSSDLLKHDLLLDFINKEKVADRVKQKILIVEHDPVLQVVHRNLVERLGYSVDVCMSGKEAIASCKGAKYLMILMSVQMPTMNGLEATAEIRSCYGNELPIVAFTSDIRKEVLNACLEAGMDSILARPINMQNLEMLIEKIRLSVVSKRRGVV